MSDHYDRYNGMEELLGTNLAEVGTDCISRQAAIDAINEYMVGKRCDTDGTMMARLINELVIQQLPPVNNSKMPNSLDTISRKALINKLEQWQKQDGYDNGEWNLLVDVITEIKNMPLATDIYVGTNDAISRQAAINAIDECYCGGEDSCGEPWIYQENAVEAIQMIEPIPPAHEPLTDKEQRIFLAAMERERKVCKEVDDQYTHEPYEVLLTKVCDEIKRKVKGALWS